LRQKKSNRKGGGRKPKYTDDFVIVLRIIRAFFWYRCGKILAPFLCLYIKNTRQAFADEIFRVFHDKNPKTVIIAQNSSALNSSSIVKLSLFLNFFVDNLNNGGRISLMTSIQSADSKFYPASGNILSNMPFVPPPPQTVQVIL